MQKDPLGDGKSSIELLGIMGSDLTVVNAARVSFRKTSAEISARDIRLINYLARHGHWTPFAQPQLQFRIKMPIFVARQWFRHQVGFVRNEVSRRYVIDNPEFYTPLQWRLQAQDKKQGSRKEVHPESKDITDAVSVILETARTWYSRLTDMGIAAELARIILPLATYTEFIETGSLAAYARLVTLRCKDDAQQEIRAYADSVSDIIEAYFPYSWAALRRYASDS